MLSRGDLAVPAVLVVQQSAKILLVVPAVRRIAIIADAFVTTSWVEDEAFLGGCINADYRARR
jgi:hypothetical protein